ncbi:fumarylacetoacetate hydrolase family protein [Microbacterium sp. 18062]|uniref:fumarylacetoacetate hydrolase family protein n=1 Tax=Microbacterium sp. 18062 TaxID=2681410 RepID=UPI00135CED1A|nr:fumarylacetoacetate hydrolase family protein [Microbacterium sp. 18062]
MRLGLFGGGRLGVVVGDLVHDASALVPIEAAGVGGALAALIRSGAALDADDVAAAPAFPLEGIEWEAPLPRPGKIIGAPANYFEHVDEMPDSSTVVEWGVFLKAGTSVLAPGGTIRLPYLDKRTDHEGELAVVIGRGGRDISLESARAHVFGYTCALDITVRSTEDRSTRKSFDTFTPLGPLVVTADELGSDGDLGLRLTVNGGLRQESTTAKLIYGVPELIAYASSVMTLEPGDVIATGTPAGVGPIVDGDVVEVSIDRVGSLRVEVTADGAIRYADRPGPRTALQRG